MAEPPAVRFRLHSEVVSPQLRVKNGAEADFNVSFSSFIGDRISAVSKSMGPCAVSASKAP